MHWIIQDNLFIENKRGALVQAIERLGISYQLMNIGPNGIEEDIENDGQPIITNGSVMLSKIAHARGWRPGGFWSDQLTYEVWGREESPWHDLLLNRHATTTRLSEAQFPSDALFVRPTSDSKTFNGRVFTRDEFLKMQSESANGKKTAPKPDTMIVLAPVRKIGQEHRHYVVDGEIITSSRYKLAGTPNFKEGADEVVLDCVRDAIRSWQPARAFVIDTYIAGQEVGIVEAGCIGNAGLYEADLLKLVNALDTMPMEIVPRKSLSL